MMVSQIQDKGGGVAKGPRGGFVSAGDRVHDAVVAIPITSTVLTRESLAFFA